MPTIAPRPGTSLNFRDLPLSAGDTIKLSGTDTTPDGRITAHEQPESIAIMPSFSRAVVRDPFLALDVRGTNGLALRDLDLVIDEPAPGATALGAAAQMSGVCDGLMMERVLARGGTSIQGARQWRLEQCRFTWAPSLGLYLASTGPGLIRSCIFDHNGLNDVLHQGAVRLHGLYGNSDADYQTIGCLFAGNGNGGARTVGMVSNGCVAVDNGAGLIAHDRTRGILGALVSMAHHPAGALGGYGIKVSNGRATDTGYCTVAYAGPATSGQNLWGISVSTDLTQAQEPGTSAGVKVHHCKVYDWAWGGQGVGVGIGPAVTGASVTDCEIQQPRGGIVASINNADVRGCCRWERNVYWSPDPRPFWIEGRGPLTWEEWKEATGDTSEFRPIIYEDPDRTPARFLREVLGLPGLLPSRELADAAWADPAVIGRFRAYMVRGLKLPVAAVAAVAPPPTGVGPATL